MSIKRTITTTILAASLALTAALPAVAQNSSETGHGTRTTREGKVTATSSKRVRGEMEGTYVNYGTGGFIGFIRMDMGSEFAAEYMLDMMRDPDLMAGELDMGIEGSFRVRGMGDCAGLYGDNDGMDMYIVFCVDGTYANMLMATDKDEALDVMEAVQLDGELVLPRGYEEYAS